MLGGSSNGWFMAGKRNSLTTIDRLPDKQTQSEQWKRHC